MAHQFQPGPLGRHFIREWMESRTREDGKKWVPDDLAVEMESVSGMSISAQTVRRIANIEQGYSQYQLEVMARVFGCQPWDLLIGPPSAPIPEEHKWRTEIQTLSEQQREQVLQIARVIRRGGQPDSIHDNFVTPTDTKAD